MYAYIRKQIETPELANTFAWDSESGWLACGCQDGSLQVLHLTEPLKGDPSDIAELPQLRQQVLRAHSAATICAAWSSPHRKLITGDAAGTIIVWAQGGDAGQWVQEMANQRPGTQVADIAWSPDGHDVCIAWSDGFVIRGGFAGNRLWAQDMGGPLACIQWSADSRTLCIGTGDGRCVFRDGSGCPLPQDPFHLQDVDCDAVVGITCHQGPGPLLPQSLAVCYADGRVTMQSSTSGVQHDSGAVASGLQSAACLASTADGSLMAVGGTSPEGSAAVHFISRAGNLVRVLDVPGEAVTSAQWDGSGGRLALCNGVSVYLAEVVVAPIWGHISTGIVCAKPPEQSSALTGCASHQVFVLGAHSKEKRAKRVPDLLMLAGEGELWVHVTGVDSSAQTEVTLRNADFEELGRMALPWVPTHLAVTGSHVIATSEGSVLVWEINIGEDGSEKPGASTKIAGLKTIFGIDQAPPVEGTMRGSWRNRDAGSADKVTAIHASASWLLMGRSSGSVQSYELPSLRYAGRAALGCRPLQLALNCDATQLALLDIHGQLQFLPWPLQQSAGAQAPVEAHPRRQDVAHVLWAVDDPALCAVRERGNLCILRNGAPMEQHASTAHLCSFSNLEVQAVQLEALQEACRADDATILWRQYQLQSIADADLLLSRVPVQEALPFCEEHSHPRLWRSFGNACLEQQAVDLAEQAFVACQDFLGVEFVRHLASLDDEMLKAAAAATYFGRAEEAHNVYIAAGRPDLALQLHAHTGDWLRVEAMLTEGGGSMEQLQAAWKHIGDACAWQGQWKQAGEFYGKAECTGGLCHALLQAEEFSGMEQLCLELPQRDALLLKLGARFQAAGLVQQAVDAFCKAGAPERAVNCCARFGNAEAAQELAEAFGVQWSSAAPEAIA